MGATSSSSSPGDAAPDRLAVRAFFRFVLRFVMAELARRGVPERDQEDIAQEAIVAAWRGRAGYDGNQGSPAAWLRGITTHKLADRARRLGRQVGDLALDSDDTPEHEFMHHDDERLTTSAEAELLLAWLGRQAPSQARVVWLRGAGGLTFEEVGAVEGISSSEAERRYKAGVTALRGRQARDERRLAVVPLELLLRTDLPDVPPGVEDRVLARVGEHLGFDLAPSDPPPPSGVRRRPPTAAPSPRPRPSPPWRAIIGGVGVGVALLLGMSTRGEGPPRRAARDLAPLEVPTVAFTWATATPVLSAEPVPRLAKPTTQRPPPLTIPLANHARRSPQNAHAGARACAALVGAADPRCSL